MIVLEPGHPAVLQEVKKWSATGKHKPTETKLSDFDGTSYCVATSGDNASVLSVSIRVHNFARWGQFGVKQYLASVYGAALQETPRSEYDVTLCYTRDQVSSAEAAAEVASKVSCLKRNVLGGPLMTAIERLLGNAAGAGEIFDVRFRQTEGMYVIRKEDRVVLIFAFAWDNEDDRVLSHVFLQEFADAYKTVKSAPRVVAREGAEPMAELQGVPKTELVSGKNTTWIMFAIEKHRFTPDRTAKMVDLVVMLRTYLHYHMKCSKAYMHMRMRRRSEALLQVLRRAQPEQPKAGAASASAASV